MWVISITAPSLFYFAMEDPALIISMNANEEEPGEVEKKDSTEETLVPRETLHIQMVIAAAGPSLILKDQIDLPDIIREIILPPPEYGSRT
jgi:hypothetical protein